jgi:protein-disulfide isomerase
MRLFRFAAFLIVGTLLASDHADRTVGSPNAPLTLEVWSDFQCPHCAQLHFGAMKEAMADCVASGKVRVIFRDYILPQMPYSRKAAQYADAAARIGRYERVCDLLFRTQQEWGRTGDVDAALAKELTPAEIAKVHKILADPKAMADINADLESDMALARKIPLESTPTMILSGNGKRYPITGDARYDFMRQLIDRMVAK